MILKTVKKKIKALKDNLQYEYDLQNFNQVIKEIEEDNCQKEIVSVDFLIRSCFLTAIKEYLEKHLIDEVASYGLGKNLIEFAKKDSKCLDLLKETYFKKINERLDDLYLSIKKHR